MAKSMETKSLYIVMFVEGDTDELFFKALLEYYRSISRTSLVPCDICNLKGVTRYASKLLAKLKNEYLPESCTKNYNLQTVCCSYDTDVFEMKNPFMVDWNAIAKNMKRMGIGNLIRIGVKSSIEDWILDDIEGVCRFLKMKEVPASLKGTNGNEKISDLYKKAKRTYQKGYAARELISTLNMDVVRKKRLEALRPLENALGVNVKEP